MVQFNKVQRKPGRLI